MVQTLRGVGPPPLIAADGSDYHRGRSLIPLAQRLRRLEAAMDRGSVTGTEFGALVRQRREAMAIEIDGLVRAIGGTPGSGFLARLEDGLVGPSSSLVLKLAAALGLPGDTMLNAAGFASNDQRADALVALGGAVTARRTDGA